MSNNSIVSNQTLSTIANLYHYLDDLFEQDSDSDTLFAGGYLRGISSSVATDFGDESQMLSVDLLAGITTKLSEAKAELSPQDYAIVTNFWLEVQSKITNKA